MHAARNGNFEVCQVLVERGNCKVGLAAKVQLWWEGPRYRGTYNLHSI